MARAETGLGRPGSRQALRVARFADGRSDSVGESRSRVVIAEVGLPAPDLQHEVRDADGRLVGITDFWWEEQRLVGEFDGRIKYGRDLRGDRAVEDVVYAEKLREDDIRRQRAGVVRWTWGELDRPGTLRAKIRRALDDGPGHRYPATG